MRTRHEVAACNAAHVRRAVETAQSPSEARKLLREEGFMFKPRVVRVAWDSVRAEPDEPGSLFDHQV